jgi:hypothetical protein
MSDSVLPIALALFVGLGVLNWLRRPRAIDARVDAVARQPPPSPRDVDAVVSSFQSKQRLMWIVCVPLLLVGGVLFFGSALTSNHSRTLPLVGWTLWALGILVGSALSRCPRCGIDVRNRGEARGRFDGRQCPRCGIQLSASPSEPASRTTKG